MSKYEHNEHQIELRRERQRRYKQRKRADVDTYKEKAVAYPKEIPPPDPVRVTEILEDLIKMRLKKINVDLEAAQKAINVYIYGNEEGIFKEPTVSPGEMVAKNKPPPPIKNQK